MNNSEDNIRKPDEVVRETLLEDNRDNYQKQIDEAMYLSMQEMNQEREINHEYEEKILKDYADETNRRVNLFKNFMANITKLMKLERFTIFLTQSLTHIVDNLLRRVN